MFNEATANENMDVTAGEFDSSKSRFPVYRLHPGLPFYDFNENQLAMFKDFAIKDLKLTDPVQIERVVDCYRKVELSRYPMVWFERFEHLGISYLLSYFEGSYYLTSKNKTCALSIPNVKNVSDFFTRFFQDGVLKESEIPVLLSANKVEAVSRLFLSSFSSSYTKSLGLQFLEEHGFEVDLLLKRLKKVLPHNVIDFKLGNALTCRKKARERKFLLSQVGVVLREVRSFYDSEIISAMFSCHVFSATLANWLGEGERGSVLRRNRFQALKAYPLLVPYFLIENLDLGSFNSVIEKGESLQVFFKDFFYEKSYQECAGVISKEEFGSIFNSGVKRLSQFRVSYPYINSNAGINQFLNLIVFLGAISLDRIPTNLKSLKLLMRSIFYLPPLCVVVDLRKKLAFFLKGFSDLNFKLDEVEDSLRWISNSPAAFNVLSAEKVFKVRLTSWRKWSREAHEAHHRMTLELNLLKMETEKIPDWKPLIKGRDSGLVINGYDVVELKNRSELNEEGSVQHHCVGGYYNYCYQNSHRIFSLRKEGKIISTLSLVQSKNKDRPWVVDQHYGVGNTNVSQSVLSVGVSLQQMIASKTLMTNTLKLTQGRELNFHDPLILKFREDLKNHTIKQYPSILDTIIR